LTKCAVQIFNTLCLMEVMETQIQVSMYVVDTVKGFCTPLHLGIGFDYSRKQSVPMILSAAFDFCR
jgi:hypothetical protein